MAEIKKMHLIGLIEVLEKINTKVKCSHPLEEEVYEWCQTQALDLGNYLETAYLEVESSSMIEMLEDYCEQIYQLSLTQEEPKRHEIAAKIQADLAQVKGEIQDKLPG